MLRIRSVVASTTYHGLNRHCVRMFGQQVDPPYMVEFDEHYVDPKSIQVPYLRDKTRMEMYQKFKNEPLVWTLEKLSQHYGTSLDRTNAVLFLMQKREEMQKKLGVDDITSEQKHVFEKYMSDPLTFTPEKLSEESAIPLPQMHELLKNMKAHSERMNTLQDAENHYVSVMAVFEEQGIDTTFKEIPKDSRLAKKYHPIFFGDDQEEETVNQLKRQIAKDTRAVIEPSVDDYLKTADKSTLVAPQQPNHAQVKTDKFSRWKFAFKDTSKLGTQPTMIRTRGGGWRVATPLEEAHRSWSPKPSFINYEMNKHKYAEYADFDKDDGLAAQFAQRKREALDKMKKAKEATKSA